MTHSQIERGAALVTVLLFVSLLLIVITSMLTVTGNEVVISGLQRDSVRAMELAQAAQQEAVRRMESGRLYVQFTSSLSPNATVTVRRVQEGPGSAYQEIQAAGRAGRALRRLSLLVLQQAIMFPPNITFADSLTAQGEGRVDSGDVYARTFVRYKQLPADPSSLTYAGWRIAKDPDGGPAIAPCYKLPCPQSTWFPGTRRSVSEITSVGQDILAWAGAQATCSSGGAPRIIDQPEYVSGDRLANEDPVGANDRLYGFDDDGGLAVSAQLPCGFAYKWARLAVDLDEDGTLEPGEARWFKLIIFEQWFLGYWTFNEAQMMFVKTSSLAANPRYGAIPPFPEFQVVEGNYDCKKNGGGTISSLPLSCQDPTGTTISSDLGCKSPEMACSPAVSRLVSFWLDGGNWTMNGPVKGHGTIVVDGDLTVNGEFEYWGTVIVNGTFDLGAGQAILHGGLVAKNTLDITGGIKLFGGGTIANVPVGLSVLIGKAWWER